MSFQSFQTKDFRHGVAALPSLPGSSNVTKRLPGVETTWGRPSFCRDHGSRSQSWDNLGLGLSRFVIDHFPEKDGKGFNVMMQKKYALIWLDRFLELSCLVMPRVLM